MFEIRRSQNRGHARHGWLETFYTFSFARYHDPAFMGFSALRVLNQDFVQPGQGFPNHGHENMEIVTYVLDGLLEHRDSLGTGSQIRPGEVQLMSAGTGVTHSEFNASSTQVLHLLQMWVLPAAKDTAPRYEQKPFAPEELADRLRLVVSPDGADGSLTIGQDARLFAGRLSAGAEYVQELDRARSGWLHVARGSAMVNGQFLSAGDGVALRDEPALEFQGRDDAEIVLFDLP